MTWLLRCENGGQLLFWAGLCFYGVFVLMLWQRDFGPVDVNTGAILTLSTLAFGESSIGFAAWCTTQADHHNKEDWARWMMWCRPIVVVHVAFLWILAVYFGHAAPLDAVLIGLALCVFALGKTLPGVNTSGRLGNGLLIFSIAIPCLAVGLLGRAFGSL
jgi:hypothetical protein